MTERAISRRQLATDRASCTTLLAIAYPTTATLRKADTELGDRPGVTRARSEPASSSDPTPPCCDGGAYSTGYYRIVWEDVVDINVTATTAYLQWTWTGSCVDWASGWGEWWWRNGTGWSLQYSRHDLYNPYPHGCEVITSATDAVYLNDFFCSNNVWIDIYDAQAYANQWGEFGGGFWWNTATHCDNGPDLHWHDEIARWW